MIGFIALIPRLEAQLMGRLFGQDSFEGDVKEFKVALGKGRVLLNHPNVCQAARGEKTAQPLPGFHRSVKRIF